MHLIFFNLDKFPESLYAGTREAIGKFQCEYFWFAFEREFEADWLTDKQRQVKGLQRNEIECFAYLTFHVEEPGGEWKFPLQ